uniref:RNA-dependent RNA polymerase n=1 Tax=Helicobasidium mompa partitivirus V1-2 TaxID=233050 RepID=Q6BE42_9VIRU|nr:RNA-dependent RNA polymerase [Helicobasidium mompa partitivirus V1-2]
MSAFWNLEFHGMDPFAPNIPQFLLSPSQHYVSNHAIIKDQFHYQALDIVTEWFRPPHPIHPVHYTDLRWYPWKLSMSAERPFTFMQSAKDYVKQRYEAGLIPNRSLKFGNLYTPIFEYCRHYHHNVKNGRSPILDLITLHVKPALVLVSSGIDKVRTVFGVPKYLIFAEAMFFWPLFSIYFTSANTPLLWNYESLNGGWHRLDSEYHARYTMYSPIFNLDWSEFDMRVYFTVWSDIIDRVSTYFCFCGRYCPTLPVLDEETGTQLHPPYSEPFTNPQRLRNLWFWIRYAYFNMAAVTTTGKIFKRSFAGMPSGIFCTQFYDSFYNAVIIVTCLLALGYEVRHDHLIKLMGDDALFGLLESIPIEHWSEFLDALAAEALFRFNAKLSATKCGYTRTIQGATVLSYTNWNGWPVRSAEDVLAHLLHPKSLKDSAPRLMARSIGLYYASGANPRIRPICEHIFSTLKHQGFTVRKVNLAEFMDPRGLGTYNIEVDNFPSPLEAMCRLSRPSTRSEEIQSQYWDRSHFEFDAGQVRNCQSSF